MVNCFRGLGIRTLKEAEEMSFYEYRIRMEAYNLRQFDTEFHLHELAWLNREVKAERKSGKKTKPVYRTFKQFFDYEKILDRFKGKKEKQDETNSAAARYREYMRRRGEHGGKL